MLAAYPWIKALHVIFMVTWFAGLFYLPRLFIYHRPADDQVSRDRFVVMERRLFGIMTLGAVLTAVLGSLLLLINTALLHAGWLHFKLLLLVGLVAYHYRCYRWMQILKTEAPNADTRWLRWFNEIPVAFLFAIVLVAITKLPV